MKKNNNKIPFSTWLIFMTLMIGFFISGFINLSKTESATTTTWLFTTGGNYTYDSSLIEVTGGVARLVALDQVDNDNDATGGFGAGTHSDTQWDASNLWAELDSTGLTNGTGSFTSRIMDAGTSTAQWTNFAWNPQRPYLKELPDNFTTETAYLSGNIQMHNNMLLFHMNESTTNAEEGGTVSDTSGQGNNGTLYTGSDGLNKSSSTAMFVSSTEFDGENDYIEVPDDNSLDMGTPSTTVMAWVRSLNSTSTPPFLRTANRLIASKAQAGTAYQLGINTDNKPYFAFEDIGTDKVFRYDNTIESASDTTGTNGRIPLGVNTAGDDTHVYYPSVIKDGSTYKMWYSGNDGATIRIFYATSPDGLTWTKNDNSVESPSDTTGTNGRLPLGVNTAGDDAQVQASSVIKDGNTYKMWYSGSDGSSYRIFYATSPDGLTWTKYDNSVESASDTTGTNGRIPLGVNTAGDDTHVYYPSVIKDGSTYKMWYSGNDGATIRIFYATSPDGLTWTKNDNSVESPSDTTGTNGRIPLGTFVNMDNVGTFAPTVIKDGGTYKMWYSGTSSFTDRMAYATSPDGLTWTKYDNSIESAGGMVGTNGRLPLGDNLLGDENDILAPSAIKDGSTYKIWYVGAQTGVHRIFYATLETGATSTNAISATDFTHLAGVVDGTTIKLYVNGSLDTSTTTAVSTVSNGGTLRIGDMFDGAIDEVAVFNRVLSATEITDIYRRGANKLKYQVRTCDDAACSGEIFIGPDGTATDYYEEADSNVTTTPSLSLTNLADNRYFQYKAFFDTSSTTLNVELKSVTTTPAHYYGNDATVINSSTAPAYSVIASFTETLGGNNAGTIRYQLSPDNVYWHYYNWSNWVSSTAGYATANTSTIINTNIGSFDDDVGSGNFYLKAYYRSVSSTQLVELDEISIVTDPEIYFTSSTHAGDEGATPISLIVELDTSLGVDATVNYVLTGTATSSGIDYTLADGTATVTAGNTTTTISLVIVDDSLDEDSETVILTLSNPSNSILGTTTTYTYTITDNDTAPTVAFTGVTGSGAESATPVDIEVLLSAVSGKSVTVDYALSGTASGSGTDYTLANGTATIAAGDTTVDISLAVVDDASTEDSETVVLTLSNPGNSSLGANTTHTYTITDNDNSLGGSGFSGGFALSIPVSQPIVIEEIIQEEVVEEETIEEEVVEEEVVEEEILEKEVIEEVVEDEAGEKDVESADEIPTEVEETSELSEAAVSESAGSGFFQTEKKASASSGAIGEKIEEGKQELIRLTEKAAKFARDSFKTVEIAMEDLGETTALIYKASKAAAIVAAKATKEVIDNTAEIVEENEVEIKTTLTVATPAIMAFNPVTAVNLPYIPAYAYHMLGMLPFLGIRKRKRNWGVIYNAITKNPIPLAIVRLYTVDQGQEKQKRHLTQTTVTDKKGRFGFLPTSGSYTVEVIKPRYTFPSNIMNKEQKQDGEYENLYYGEAMNIQTEDVLPVQDIPMDPTREGSMAMVKNKPDKQKNIISQKLSPVVAGARHVFGYMVLPVMIGGMVFSVSVAYVSLQITDISLLAVYGAMTFMHVKLKPKREKSWGVVFNSKTMKPIELSVISIMDTKFNKILKSRLTDYKGRYYFMPPIGKYRLRVVKKEHSFPSKIKKGRFIKDKLKYKHPYYGEDIEMKKENGFISADIPLDIGSG